MPPLVPPTLQVPRLVRCVRLWLGGCALAGAVMFAADAGPELIASNEPGWPQFRGPRRDGVSDERDLLAAWPEGGPKEIWTVNGVGRGFSAPVIAGGRVILAGDFGAEARILAFDLQGKPLWSSANGRAWQKEYPGARASVTCNGGRVFHLNAHGRLAVFDARDGREVWAVDLAARFRTRGLTWGLSECVVVDERTVYATAGGRDALMVALDKSDGGVRWRSEPLFDAEGDNEPESPGYASPILVRFAGRRLLIGCSLRYLFCVDADSGKLQWTRRRPTSYGVQAMMPVLAADGVFMSAPYGPSGRLYRLLAPARPGEAVGVDDGWSTRLDACQGGVVRVGNRMYGAFYTPRKGWAAVDATTGAVLYESPEIVKGAGLAADGLLYSLAEDGWMYLLRPGEKQFEIKGRFRLAEAKGRDAWTHPVICDGRLYLRYHDTLRCYDVRPDEAERRRCAPEAGMILAALDGN